MKRSGTLLCVILAFLGGFSVGEGRTDTEEVRKAAYEAGLDSGVCHPVMYEDGSFVLEDGRGQLCVKP